jgi:hypothetical protein
MDSVHISKIATNTPINPEYTTAIVDQDLVLWGAGTSEAEARMEVLKWMNAHFGDSSRDLDEVLKGFRVVQISREEAPIIKSKDLLN